MNIILALSPIIIVLVGMIVLKKSAVKVAPVAMVFTIILGIVAFGGNTETTILSLKVGILDGIRIVWLIWAAFAMLTLMQETGAMEKIKDVIAEITNDKRVHIILIAVILGVFLEGAAGAGTPAAIAAPFLVGLGFTPIVAATAALISNSIPVSWGGAGVTTIMGIGPVSDYMTVMQASSMAGRIHMIGAIILPFLVVLVIFGKKGFKNLVPFLAFVGIVLSFFIFIFSNFVDPSITSLGAGLVTMIFAIIFLRKVKINTPKEFLYSPDIKSEKVGGDLKAEEEKEIVSKNNIEKRELKSFIALSPYLVLVILLPVVRFSFPLSILSKYGYTIWVGIVVILSAFIGSRILKVKASDFLSYCGIAFKKVIPALIAMCGLLVLSNVMVDRGMMSLLAKALSDSAGQIYPYIAVLVGSLGSFMTGTGLGSNIMFGPMHVEAATALNMNPITVFAGQNVGAAIGNMICPNNVVAVATTVGILGKEGILMRKVLPAFFVFLILYGTIAYLYTHVIFKTFGM